MPVQRNHTVCVSRSQVNGLTAPGASISLDQQLAYVFTADLGQNSADRIGAWFRRAYPMLPPPLSPQLLLQGIEAPEPHRKHSKDSEKNIGGGYLRLLSSVAYSRHRLVELVVLLQIAKQPA